MTSFFYYAIAAFCLTAVVHAGVVWLRKRTDPLDTISKNPFAWSAVVLPAVALLLPSQKLPSVFSYVAPVVYLGLVTLIVVSLYVFATMNNFSTCTRVRCAALLVCLAAVLAGFGWTLLSADFPYAHPTVRLVEARSRRIESSRKAMNVTLVSMNRTLDALELPVTDPATTLADIQLILAELIDLADRLDQQYRGLVADHKQFLAHREGGPALFREAAKVWRQYALDEKAVGYPEISERYAEVAELWDAYADTIKSEQNDPLDMQQLDEVMAFIARARLMLARLSAHFPFLTSSELLGKRADLQVNLKVFLQQFDELRAAIRHLTEQLRLENDSVKPPGAGQEQPHEHPDSEDRTA